MAAMTWPGQFNADFMTFLSLSGLWIAWRHHFSAGGMALGFRTQGDVKALLFGVRRARN